MSKFKKGQSGNPNGRPKGAKNKDTKALRERINHLLNKNWEAIQTDLEELTPKERIDAYIKLLEYALPKLQRTELSTEQSQDDDRQVVIFQIPDNGRENHN